jgi:hypothetical protein
MSEPHKTTTDGNLGLADYCRAHVHPTAATADGPPAPETAAVGANPPAAVPPGGPSSSNGTATDPKGAGANGPVVEAAPASDTAPPRPPTAPADAIANVRAEPSATTAPSQSPGPAALVLTADPFGPPSLLPGENRQDFDQLLAGISDAVKPVDFIDKLLVRSAVDLTFESIRLRRLKPQLLRATMHKAMADLLRPYYTDAEDFAFKWVVRDKVVMTKIDGMLAGIRISLDTVVAKALSMRLEEYSHIDRLISSNDARREAVFREIDRRHAVFAKTLRHAVQEAEDAEFEVIEADALAGGTARE